MKKLGFSSAIGKKKSKNRIFLKKNKLFKSIIELPRYKKLSGQY
jgi:hypothetical protein